MQMTAVYACVRILAEAVASLPLHLYRERAGTTGGKERATAHPLYRVLHDEPHGVTCRVFLCPIACPFWGVPACSWVLR